MAVTFFWRCEGTTLDGTDDFTAGDNTATANNTPSISGTAALVGSNGMLFDSVSDGYRFNPASLISASVGSAAFLFRFPTAIPASNTNGSFLVRGSASANDTIFVTAVNASGDVMLTIRNASAGAVTLSTSSAGITTATTYAVVIRWDQPNDSRAIELYDSGGVLIDSTEDTATAFTAPASLDAADGLRFGDIGGGLGTCYMDNVFIADAYDEPLQNNLFITSWTQYDAGGGATAHQVPHRMAWFGVG